MNNITTSIDPDIYFNNNYGKLYEKIEGGDARVFHYKDELGEIKNQFIVREIPAKIDGETYFDIITPNGYGGPIILNCNENKKSELVSRYEFSFSNYCVENKIISEFVRFHPLVKNVHDFSSLYNVSINRKTLGTNLSKYDDPIKSEFSKSCRKNIRKALNKGVTFEIIEKPNDIGEFKEIYYSTMNRNDATGFYYFGEDYFSNVLDLFRNNVLIVKAIFEEKAIAQGLYFIYGRNIHIHLSGTLSEYLHLSPAYILRYGVTLWGKENGYEMIHHGGGRSNSEDDGLYRFKKGFAQNTEFDFYIGKKIWNNDIYNKLCERNQITDSKDFFPKYRYGMSGIQ